MFEILSIIIFCLVALLILFPTEKKKSKSELKHEEIIRKITKIGNAIYKSTCSAETIAAPTCRKKTKFERKIEERRK